MIFLKKQVCTVGFFKSDFLKNQKSPIPQSRPKILNHVILNPPTI